MTELDARIDAAIQALNAYRATGSSDAYYRTLDTIESLRTL